MRRRAVIGMSQWWWGGSVGDAQVFANGLLAGHACSWNRGTPPGGAAQDWQEGLRQGEGVPHVLGLDSGHSLFQNSSLGSLLQDVIHVACFR